ncbi:hypothetical protein [Paludibaculum fermentans]|uniref:Glycosyltransferase RgtA/B/C/D-like domain-containing protein n=1 Tax=Paludibaculum fermentans TaxID=1473598 RepID=A0A7S7SN84_PALFE|nr:hypothetical protein [Paludibaculum fermentans]QOY90291.1 hypothetical protein IRI77_10140 [Paludibaculum fermentans]
MTRLRWKAGALLGVVIFLVHAASPVAASGDSRWNVFEALSLIHHGDLNLDEYQPRIEASQHYAITKPDGHYRPMFPAGTALLATPAVAALEATLHVLQPVLEPLARRTASPVSAALLRGDLENSSVAVEILIASLWIALAGVMLHSAALELSSVGTAAALALVFAFASPAWSTGSRALGMQAADMLLLSGAILAAVRAERKPVLWAVAGALLSFAFFTRPTNAIPAAVFAVWAITRGRRPFLLLVSAAAPIALLFALRNYSIYGALLEPYYRPTGAPQGTLGWHASLSTALVGHLISPARGLFIYAPILLAAIPGFFLWWRQPERRPLAAAMAAIALLHYLLISSFSIWWGGYCNGPRLFSDVLPVFVVLLIPVFDRWRGHNPAFKGLLMVGVLCGLWCNGWPTWNQGPANWNTVPNKIDGHTERLWDWSDPPFLRGIRGRT